MSNPFASFLTPSTWRTLGLCVGATYIGLGSLGVLAPATVADSLGLIPNKTNSIASNKEENAIQSDSKTVSPSMKKAMLVLGARDVSIGLSIILCGLYQPNRSMGLVILAGLPLCITDIICTHQEKGIAIAAPMAFGAATWMVTGAGLLGPVI